MFKGDATYHVLPLHERVAAISIIIFFVSLAVLNLYLDEGDELPAAHGALVADPLVEVTIVGAVRSPGLYRIKKGALVEEALEMAAPLESANLSKIKKDSKIIRRRKIVVPEKKGPKGL